MLLTPFTAVSFGNNWSECVKFETLKHFHFLCCASMWKNCHQNAQCWKWFVTGWGKVLFAGMCMRFPAQNFTGWGMKGLIEKGKRGSLVPVLSIFVIYPVWGWRQRERVLKVRVNSFCNHWEMWCNSLLWSVRLSGWLHMRQSMVCECGCAVHERLAPGFWPHEFWFPSSMAIKGIGRNAVLLYSRADTVLCCVSLIDISPLEGNFMFEREWFVTCFSLPGSTASVNTDSSR